MASVNAFELMRPPFVAFDANSDALKQSLFGFDPTGIVNAEPFSAKEAWKRWDSTEADL